MAFWLAKGRKGQRTEHIQRFDPRFWTVDFPRPEMGSVVTTGPASLRVELEFHRENALAGLIWESEDQLDHPLLAYATDRDYSRTTLRFRWRSGGVLALDQVHGPTLTIEGRDAAGAARSWYVRLWNYASGTPTDARIVLRFSHIDGGWMLPEEAQPVHPHDIDRMFISLAPPGYDPAGDALLPERADGWVELSEIACEGDRPLVEIGDVLLPPHDIRMATAYDDCYNQTPARLLRNIRGLGYRDEIIHYVGMSHYFRLRPESGERLLVDEAATLSGPCAAWHDAYFRLCRRQGYQPIASLSYELFAEHCPGDWQQRAHDGSPALTGWEPPSTLLSPANGAAMAWLRQIALRFVDLMLGAQVSVVFQIGEPWWWVQPGHAPCLYDTAARASFADAAEAIADMRGPFSAGQLAVLDTAGTSLGLSTRALRDAVRDRAGPDALVYLLAFTPTVLHRDMPELHRANLPPLWAWPEYDRLQLEDYDWLTEGAEAARRRGYEMVQARLAYPLERQDYMAGFVLLAQDAETMWPLIDAGLREAAERGVPRRFVWALPQVCRDGFTRLPDIEDIAMQAFDDLLYPLALGRDAGSSPEFSTAIAVTASGHERRNSLWSDARLRFDAGPGLRGEEELGTLIAFFRARRGAARGFRLRDPFDFSSNGMTNPPTMFDQLLGMGDGLSASFPLRKRYGEGVEPQARRITRPRADSIIVSLDGIATHDWALRPGGIIEFTTAPPSGAQIRAGFLFDVPVRFAEDRLDINGATFAAGEAPSVPLIEIREAA